MAEQKWPERIGYRWTDENTDTPYSLTFDNPQSAISFIISQRNNLASADELLSALFDADTGKSLADEEAPTSTDDVIAAAPQGVILPEPTPADDAETEPVPDPAVTDVPATVPAIPTDTGTQIPTVPDTTVPDTAVPDSSSDTNSDGSTPTDTPDDTATDAPPVSSDTPTDSLPDTSEEDTDFDSADEDKVPDDGPVDSDTAPAIGVPTVESPGVTGV